MLQSFHSTKLYDGFSTVFRQWRADTTHCKFLHGYAVSFRVTFAGELDSNNWVFDFGGLKRAKNKIDGMNPKEWLDYMFDHTTIIAKDDPLMWWFTEADAEGLIQLRVLENTGAERFAQYLYQKLNAFVQAETDNRVRVTQVEFMENGKNSAIYREDSND